MAFSEGLSDTGELTGRGNPMVRGAITGVGTFIGGILHTLPFLIPHYQAALYSAVAVVALELEPRSAYVMQATIRWGWQHSIPPGKTERYSVTYRTLRRSPRRVA